MVRSYNKATVGAAMLMQRLEVGLRTNQVVSVGAQPFQVEAQSGDAFSNLRCYDQWLSADDWNQIGLSHRYRNEGLGARLVAIRTNQQKTALELHQPDEGIIHPSTAILRFESAYGESADTRRAMLMFWVLFLMARLLDWFRNS